MERRKEEWLLLRERNGGSRKIEAKAPDAKHSKFLSWELRTESNFWVVTFELLGERKLFRLPHNQVGKTVRFGADCASFSISSL